MQTGGERAAPTARAAGGPCATLLASGVVLAACAAGSGGQAPATPADAGARAIMAPGAADAGTGEAAHASTYPPCTPDTWEPYARAFFAARCVQCHATYAELPAIAADARRIRDDIRGGTMPPAGRLDPRESSQIDRWLECDLPP